MSYLHVLSRNFLQAGLEMGEVWPFGKETYRLSKLKGHNIAMAAVIHTVNWVFRNAKHILIWCSKQ